MIDPAIRAGDTLFSIDSEPVTGRRFETIMQMLQEAVQKAKEKSLRVITKWKSWDIEIILF